MKTQSELEQLINEIDASFARQSEVRNPRYDLLPEEWQLLRYNLPRQLLTPGLPKADAAPVIDRAGAMRAASLRALKTIVEGSSMSEPEWRAVLINLIERVDSLAQTSHQHV